MQAWIAVSGSEEHAIDFPQFWCFSHKASAGDLLFVYLTTKCSVHGIKHICRVGDICDSNPACTTRRMQTREVTGLFTLKKPVTYQQLANHSTLARLDGVYGRFQKTTIGISRAFIFHELLDFISEDNPEVGTSVSDITSQKYIAVR